jgi:hypothetical protein
MENLPDKRNNQQGITLIPSNRAVKVAEKLLDVNMLLPFKMEGDEIMLWALDLDRLLPDEELQKLPFLLDCFKTNEIYYDYKCGIQNIFSGLKQIKRLENGEFKVLKAIW